MITTNNYQILTSIDSGYKSLWISDSPLMPMFGLLPGGYADKPA